MAFTSICLSLLMLNCKLGLVAAQDQQVQFNQVINLNGDMQLNRLTFPDNSKIETFSQAQKQIIVNQNPNPLSANHVVGSTGQPFVQLSQNSMTIQTNKATDLVGGQIEMSIDPNVIQQMGVSSDNTFVAQLSTDRQAWVIMEGIKSVNTTDNTVRMIKMTSLDGEYMAVGRQSIETGNVLTTFNQNQQVQISGSGIQEVEFTDGFRMSIKASQPMTLKTDVVNGISSSMTGSMMTVNNYRYKVTSNLAGVATDLNSMVAVVQLPINAQRIMAMAQQMGAQPNSAISLGIAQRVVLQNPGGSSVQNLGRRQDTSSSSTSKKSSTTAGADAAASGPSTAAGSATSDSTSAVTDSAATAASSTTATDAGAATSAPPADAAAAPTTAPAQAATTQQNSQLPPTQTQATLPAAAQLLLSPTFSPVSAQALLDSQNNRIAVPVSQIDGEFILTMGMTGAGTIQVAPAASGKPGETQGGEPATSNTSNQPNQLQQGKPPASPGIAQRQAAPAAQGTITMTMAELEKMALRQATGGVMPVWSMMNEFVAQSVAQPPSGAAKKRGPANGYKAVPLRA